MASEPSKYQVGNTVRFEVIFRGWDDEITEVPMLKFIIYDNQYKKLDEIPVPLTNKKIDGTYFFDHVFDTIGAYVCEFYADIEGTPSLQRNRIKVVTVD